MRCIECGDNGHFKCRSEHKSNQIKLSFAVLDDLDEFIEKGEKITKKKKESKKLSKKNKKKKKTRRLSNSNILIPTSDSEQAESSSSEEEDNRLDYNSMKRKR